MEVITSLSNEKVINWTKLQQKKYRDLENLFIVEGDHLVMEALKANCVKELICEEDKLMPIKIPINYVTKEVLNKISTQPSPPDIMAVCEKIPEKDFGNRLLLIDELQDPGNLGTIIRSAVAFNIDTIVLGKNSVDRYNEKVIRASEGMFFHINIISRDLTEFIPLLKSNEYQVLGTNVKYGNNLKDIHLRNKFAFIIGNEGAGVKEDLLDLCDDYIYIPMNEACESLNAGVAAGIILYELNNHYFGS